MPPRRAYTRSMRAAGGVVFALGFFVAAPTRAEVDVQYKGGHVDLRATTAPLSEVLDRLARATGMKIVQQGVTPSMLLSLSSHRVYKAVQVGNSAIVSRVLLQLQ